MCKKKVCAKKEFVILRFLRANWFQPSQTEKDPFTKRSCAQWSLSRDSEKVTIEESVYRK